MGGIEKKKLMLKEKLLNMDSNNRIVLKNAFFACLIKGGALIISLLSTPAFIKYFDNNAILGVWYTMLSVIMWFLNFDLGVGNGIRNNLVKALTVNDRREAKHIVSSGIFTTALITIALSVVGITVLSVVNLNSLFNIEDNLISEKTLYISTLLVFSAIMLRFMLTTISSIFYSLQMSAVNNFLSLCVSVLQFIYVVSVHFDDPEIALVNVSLAYMILSNLPVAIAGIIVFFTKLNDCRPNVRFIDRQHINMVMKIGGIFFFCQILYMLITNTNEFLITKLYGPEYTTEYTFYYKVTSLISMVVTLAMTPIWSVVTKAMVEGNWQWLKKLVNKIQLVGIAVIAMEFLIIPVLPFVFDIWLGENSIEVNYMIALSFSCFGSAFVYSSMLSTIVCGLARMKLQAICYTVGVVFKFIFVIFVSKVTNNWSIVVWSNALLLAPYCIIQQIDLNRFLKSKLAT